MPILDSVTNGRFECTRIPPIKLLSSDGVVFKVDLDIVLQSITLKTMYEVLGCDENEVIPLPNVNSAILGKVLEWCQSHRIDHPRLEDEENREKRTDDHCGFETDFLKVDPGTLFELIMAANYLNMKCLLHASCKTIGNMIKGKTSEEIRIAFNIENNFTPAEEEQIRKENSWCEEK